MEPCNDADTAEPMTTEQATIETQVVVIASDDGDSATLLDDSSNTTTVQWDGSQPRIVLRLSATEQHLFTLLQDCVNAWESGALVLSAAAENDNKIPAATNIVVRVAGGWVRDKLLGLSSTLHDLDLALQNATGTQFAGILQTYLTQTQQEHVLQGRVGVIAANVAQSKHLETATCKLLGMDVDMTRLRAHETYTATSRIPNVAMGTPYQDAMRRDFTINALFYNISTQQVEDWTGRGMTALRQRVLQTPLDPHVTFADDPLRMLRAVRFAVRLRFTLDTTLQHAAGDHDLHDALRRKVSRERMGTELAGMLVGPHAQPGTALALLCDLQLVAVVLALPVMGEHGVLNVQGGVGLLPPAASTMTMPTMSESEGWNLGRAFLHLLPRVLDAYHNHQHAAAASSEMDVRLLYLATVMLPFRSMRYSVKKGKDLPVWAYAVRDSIKWTNKDVAAMSTLAASAVPDMLAVLEKVSAGTDHVTRVTIGLTLRNAKKLWPTSLVLATVVKMHTSHDNSDYWIEVLQRLLHIVHDWQLDECWNVKPLLDGKTLQSELMLPPGPAVSRYLTEQTRWMLQHPDGTTDQCLHHLRAFQTAHVNASATNPPAPKKPQ